MPATHRNYRVLDGKREKVEDYDKNVRVPKLEKLAAEFLSQAAR